MTCMGAGTSRPWTVRIIDSKELKEAFPGWSRPQEGRKPVAVKRENVVRDESQWPKMQQRGLYLRNHAKMIEYDHKSNGKPVLSQFVVSQGKVGGLVLPLLLITFFALH